MGGFKTGAGFLSAVAGLSSLLFTMAAPVQAEAGWVLTQRSSKIGDQYVYICQEGIKCYNPRVGFALVTRAPDWNIVLFNEKTRVYFQTTMDKWKQELAKKGITGGSSAQGWSRAGQNKIAGLAATQYVAKGSHVQALSRSLSNGGGKNAQRASVKGAELWIADEITVPAKVADLMCTAYGLPLTQNIPLKFTYQDQSGKSATVLDTYRMDKAPLTAAFFTCPGGYKAVSSDTEVMLSDEQKQIIDDMARELGSSEPPASLTGQSTQPAPAAGQPQAGGSQTISIPTSSGKNLNITRDDISRFIDAYKKQQQGK